MDPYTDERGVTSYTCGECCRRSIDPYESLEAPDDADHITNARAASRDSTGPS